jgi:hypothetical protein
MKNFLIELVNIGANLSPIHILIGVVRGVMFIERILRSPVARILGVLLKQKIRWLIGCVVLCFMIQELRGATFYTMERVLKVNKIRAYESPKFSTYILEGAGAAVGGVGVTVGTYLILSPFIVTSHTQEFAVMEAMCCGIISIVIGSACLCPIAGCVIGYNF